jgi:hypothetical protein
MKKYEYCKGKNDNKIGGEVVINPICYRNTWRKKMEESFHAGKLISAIGKKPNGERCMTTKVKDGNGVTVLYNLDGNEKIRFSYKNGEPVNSYNYKHWY